MRYMRNLCYKYRQFYRKNYILSMAALYFSEYGKKHEALRYKYRKGELSRIRRGIYIDSHDQEEINKTINSQWPKIAKYLFKNSIAVFRTAIDLIPIDGRIFLMEGEVKQKRKVEVGPIKFFVEPGNVKDGVERFHIDIESSNPTRQLLENLSRSRINDGIRKTLGREWVETQLINELKKSGDQRLNRIRDEARALAPLLGFDNEFSVLNKMISAILSTKSIKGILKTHAGKKLATSGSADTERIERFEKLSNYLFKLNLKTLSYEYNKLSWKNLAFFESYFSNYIEGTEFTLDEAEEIVSNEESVYERHEDSHDILSHIVISHDHLEMSKVPSSPEELIEILKVRHSILLAERGDRRPGKFKEKSNRAGDTVFVEPEKVEGTLADGFEIYSKLPTGIKRAFFIHFLIAEVHPFDDGNGRIARIMMNAELVAHDLHKIIVPTVCRDNYLNGMRSASHHNKFRAITKVLHQLHQYTASVNWEDYDDARKRIEDNKADKEPDFGIMAFNKILREFTGDYRSD